MVASNAICREVLTTLERVFAAEGPDEPDLGLNITYVTARAWFRRLAEAEPWEIDRQKVMAIRALLAQIAAVQDPEKLGAQLLSFPSSVLPLLDRRRRTAGRSNVLYFRRAGDRPPPSTAEFAVLPV